jgi:hemoglobin
MRNDGGSPAGLRVACVKAPGIAVGIGEELIRAVVEAFYDRVRTDADLGPIFQKILDWPAHLARMCDFWSSVILITGAYKGDVIGQHLPLPGLTERHFGRWIELFEATTRELCTPQQAAVFSLRAERIAEAIKAARSRSPWARPRPYKGSLPPLHR